MVRLHRFFLSFKFLDALLEGFNASFHVLVHLLTVAVVDVTCPIYPHRLSPARDYRSGAPTRESPESITALSGGRLKNDDALRLFSYHPAALHFRKGLGDRPVQVDGMERVGSKAA